MPSGIWAGIDAIADANLLPFTSTATGWLGIAADRALQPEHVVHATP